MMKNSRKTKKADTSKLVLFITTLISVFYIGLTFYNEVKGTVDLGSESAQHLIIQNVEK